jgi:hypothetical protein
MPMVFSNGEQSGYIEELSADIVQDRFWENNFFHYMDKYIAHGLPILLRDGPWPYLAGANLTGLNLDHEGIFFQDRITFKSEAS